MEDISVYLSLRVTIMEDAVNDEIERKAMMMQFRELMADEFIISSLTGDINNGEKIELITG